MLKTCIRATLAVPLQYLEVRHQPRRSLSRVCVAAHLGGAGSESGCAGGARGEAQGSSERGDGARSDGEQRRWGGRKQQQQQQKKKKGKGKGQGKKQR